MARVKVILRRVAPARPDGGTAGAPGPGAPPPPPPVLAVGAAIEVDLGRREARVGGHPVALATREFDLLAYLATNRGLALSRRQLLDGVWGDGWIGDERTVDVHVRQLRKKLGDGFALTTVWGIGYRLD
ncbi:MAG: winged helix-turn-helix domain-containing protein [Acidimicrobiales bacterium]